MHDVQIRKRTCFFGMTVVWPCWIGQFRLPRDAALRRAASRRTPHDLFMLLVIIHAVRFGSRLRSTSFAKGKACSCIDDDIQHFIYLVLVSLSPSFFQLIKLTDSVRLVGSTVTRYITKLYSQP